MVEARVPSDTHRVLSTPDAKRVFILLIGVTKYSELLLLIRVTCEGPASAATVATIVMMKPFFIMNIFKTPDKCKTRKTGHAGRLEAKDAGRQRVAQGVSLKLRIVCCYS